MGLPISAALGILFGREGAVQDAVVQGYEIVMLDEKARLAEEGQKRRLLALQADAKTTLANIDRVNLALKLGGAGARVEGSLSVLKQSGVVFGAEGARFGNVRLSNAGLGISEKTLIGTGAIGLIAGAGQLAGGALEAIAEVAFKLRNNKKLGDIALQALGKAAAKAGRQIFDAFGGSALVEGTVGTVTNLFGSATDPHVIHKAYEDFIEDLSNWGSGRLELQRKRALTALRNDVDFLRTSVNLYRENVASIYNDHADNSDRVLMAIHESGLRGEMDRRVAETRDAFGRPIYKLAGLDTSGQP